MNMLSSVLDYIGLRPNIVKSSLFTKAIFEIVSGNLDLSQEEVYLALMDKEYVPNSMDETFDVTHECKSKDYKKGGERVLFEPYQRVGSSLIANLCFNNIIFTKHGYIKAFSMLFYVKGYKLNDSIVDFPVVYVEFDDSFASLGGHFEVNFKRSRRKVLVIDLGWKST